MRYSKLFGSALLFFSVTAAAQTQIKPRAMVMVDTSGSMIWHFNDCNAAGDGDLNARLCDNAIGGTFACNRNLACTFANGAENEYPGSNLTPGMGVTPDGVNSRIWAAKTAMTNIILGGPDVDWGLERYALNGSCPNANWCCTPAVGATTKGRCVPDNDYYGNISTHEYITWSGGCGTKDGMGRTIDGGQILVTPGPTSGVQALRFVDGVEDFCDDGTGTPRNPELRAAGLTPLAGSVRTAARKWYQPIYNVSKVGTAGYNAGAASFDPKLDCRPYVNVVMTDGLETCEAAGAMRTSDPVTAVTELRAINAANPVKTYVIGLGFQHFEPCDAGCTGGCVGGVCTCASSANCGQTCDGEAYICSGGQCTHPGYTTLNNMAQAGGSGFARFASSQVDIEAALADIVSSSVLVEKCNATDDNCDGACDETFPDVAVSATAPDGKSCSNPHAARACNNGALAGTHCFAQGSYICSPDGSGQECSVPACETRTGASIVAGASGGRMRVTGVTGMSALNVGDSVTISGASSAGNNGTFIVVQVNSASSVDLGNLSAVIPDANNGNVSWKDQRYCPVTETCNGLDDDCDGVIDDCDPGRTPGSCCFSVMCPPCNRLGRPQPETCNGCDDDCDGTADNHLTDIGIACGSSVGVCLPGMTSCCQEVNPALGCSTDSVSTVMAGHTNPDRLVCTGGVGPSAEVCNNKDDDCNGSTDEGISVTCYQDTTGNPLTGTPSVGICRNGVQLCVAGALGTCVGAIGAQAEVCNAMDDNCNGTVDENVTDGWAQSGGDACCPTGNPADCQGAVGSQCHLGHFKCVGGAKVCVGGVARSAEICDGIDNDCNGSVDDHVPGNGAPCTSGINNIGECRGNYVCTGMSGTGPNGLTCAQTTGPMPETCNGKDDDCDGTIDNNLMDPRVGVIGGPPCVPLPVGQTNPPCDPGITVCLNGMVACQGEVLPVPNTCDGVSTDCTGMPNLSGDCPAGYECYQGNCASPCAASEFPCPAGFVCQHSTNLCIPDGCDKLHCPVGYICQVDEMGTAQCKNPCDKVTCPDGYICNLGACEDATCISQGCPAGQICEGHPASCDPDPCAGVKCVDGQYCYNGDCTAVCTGSCLDDQTCQNGVCKDDPCAGLRCLLGEVCAVISGVGVCVENLCASQGCTKGAACCGGSCIADPCATIECPDGATCRLDFGCTPSCYAVQGAPRDEIVSAGGGGFSCSVSGHSDVSPAWLLAFAMLLLVRFRRVLRLRYASLSMSGGKRPLALSMSGGRHPRARSLCFDKFSMSGVLVLLLPIVNACHSSPFCLNCGDPSKVGAQGAMANPDGNGSNSGNGGGGDGGQMMSTDNDGGCVPTNLGVEICDNLDNDCNGVVDDVSPASLVDPNNCGACGNVCSFSGQHQFGSCVNDNGVPTCKPGDCLPGYRDVDPNQPGCEYYCAPTSDPTEICDGKDNDCDSVIDNGFGYPNYAIDPSNCGGCGSVCRVSGAVAACKADAHTGAGFCGVDHCVNDGADTYRHNSAAGDIDVTGCEVHCPFPSTTVTSGSEDCDHMSCVFPAEVCDGIDNDCDFVVDNHLTDVGGGCGTCPAGGCKGECKLGISLCQNGVKLCLGNVLPTAETCDGKDNDCNGKIDDPFTQTYSGTRPLYDSDPNNCGACASSCGLANAVNGCHSDASIDATGNGVCYVKQCNAGFSYAPNFNCTGSAPGPENGPGGFGCYYACAAGTFPGALEVCDGKDNDCNGCTDDHLIQPADFCSHKGVCWNHSIPVTCHGSDGWKCEYQAALGSTVEVDASGNLALSEAKCDGLDNNCNGACDESFALIGVAARAPDGWACSNPHGAQSCTAGLGACQGQGVYVCGGGGPTCNAVADNSKASDEKCNGKDDDCNGLVDESTNAVVAGVTYHGWHDAVVRVNVPSEPSGASAHTVYVAQYEASRIDATGTSQGGSAARACSASGVVPWSNVSLANAQAACSAINNAGGMSIGRLCSAWEWQAACSAGAAGPTWSESAAPATYKSQICNDANQTAQRCSAASQCRSNSCNGSGVCTCATTADCNAGFACSGGVCSGSGVWPTGSNGSQSAATSTYCRSDYGMQSGQPARLNDMSGNVMEWTSTVVMSSDGMQYNKLRGGAYNSLSQATSCEFDFAVERPSYAFQNLGFRCCFDSAP